MRGVIFDLDGTLVDSLPGIAAALNEALSRHGFDGHPLSAVATFVGDGIRTTCQRALPEGTDPDLINRVAATHSEFYDKFWRDQTIVFPEVPELLDELKELGLALGVCSNKAHPFTVEMIAALLPAIPAKYVTGHKEGMGLKPDPASALAVARAMDLAPEELAFVGDSTVDYETARNAGMIPVLVNWGYHHADALSATGEPVLGSVTALRQALAGPGAA